MTVTTEHFHNGNTSTTTFAYTFPYYKTSDIKVKVDGTLKTESTHYNVTGTNIVFTSGNIPGNGTGNVHIYRETDVDTSKATFAAGSSIRATDLNNNETQILYHAQEQNFNTIQTADIQDGAITSAKILDGTIATADIADNAINAAKIAADAVGSSEIAADAVGASELANNAVDTNAILDDAVTSAKIGTAQVIADSLGTNAVTTAKLNNTSVTSDKLASNSVITAKIDTGAVTAAKIGTDAVTTAKILDNNITTAKIANDSITADKMADNSVDSEHYVDGSIDSEHIADNAVIASKFGNNVITNAKMADNSVDTAELVDDAVTVAKIDNAQLTTLAGMQSGTASLLAGSTALTSTTAELNLLDGKSVVTAVSGSSTDVQLPTAKAVNDQIVALMQDAGGYYPIADEVSFPNANPDPNDDAGTIVSIADAGGVVVNGSGVSTTGRTLGGATVTINGIDSSLNSTTIAAGKGMLVQTTSTLNTYTYHRLVVDEAGVAAAQTLVSDFNERYRVAASAPDSSLDEGDLWYDTGNDEMKVYDTTLSAFKAISSTGNYSILDLRNAANDGSAVYNGSIKDYTLVTKGGTSAVNPNHAAQLIVSLNGVIQEPNTGTSTPTNGFALNGSTIKFSNNLPSGTAIFIAKIGATVDIGTPSANTVTSTILQNGSVIKAKIGADAIDGTKIEDNAVDTEHIADDAVDLTKVSNSIAASLSANDAKVTNATHTGEVTGATALTIANDVIDEDNLKVDVSPTNDHVLTAKSSAAGGLTWAAVPAGVGGDAGVTFNDSVNIKLGTHEDGALYSTGAGVTLAASTPTSGSSGHVTIATTSGNAVVLNAAAATIGNFQLNQSNLYGVTIIEGPDSTTAGGLKLKENGQFNGHSVELTVPDNGVTADYSITLPAAVPTANGQALTATTAGVASWSTVETTKAGGAIYENSNTISTTHTLTANTNGMSAGPVTVNSGITLTIPSGATYTIV